MSSTDQQASSPSLESRMDTVDKALELDTRLQKLEAAIQRRLPDEQKLWWRDAKTVTLLGALLSAILPAATWIHNAYVNAREYNRQVLEQQEEIRQTYLEKVLKPGVTLSEQQQIFGLLKELSADREMQKWAQKAYQENTQVIVELTKERDEDKTKKKDLCVRLIGGTASPSEKAQIFGLDLQIQELDRKLTIPLETFGCPNVRSSD
jgi:hypothetical protein